MIELSDLQFLNISIFTLLNLFTPVLPNPPSPLDVSDNSFTSIHSAFVFCDNELGVLRFDHESFIG
jgi:hypothetical protein